jgi:hypothetical protein
MDFTRKSDIDKLSHKGQLEFYKKHFQYNHCEYNECGHEVNNTWTLCDGELFCDDCFDHYSQKVLKEATSDVERLEKELLEAQRKLNKLL